jgi:DNA-binding winged helix-turn-helix (wHTH) protein/TolB-like protein
MASQFGVMYEFGRFRLDRANRRLTRDGLLWPIPENTLQLLAMLLEKHGQIVSTEKLVNRFFPKSDFAEEELTSKVLELRQVLEDTSKEDPMVRWLPGQGYRFEAEVTAALADPAIPELGSSMPTAAEKESDPATLPQKQGQMKLGRMLGIPAAVIVLAILAVWGWRFANSGHAEAPALAGNSQMAVLPIRSLSGSADDERFDRALTVGIINALTSGLTPGSSAPVVPAASVFGYTKSTPADQLAAGRQLGVGVIVVGMAQALAGRVRVRLQMVRTEDAVQIWTGDFDGDTKDPAGLAAQIAEKIGKQMRATEGAKTTP